MGEPTPEVVWSVGSKPLSADERTTVTSIGYHTIVHTVNVKRSDSGLYHLLLRNSSGIDEGSFQVIVLGKFKFTTFLFNILLLTVKNALFFSALDKKPVLIIFDYHINLFLCLFYLMRVYPNFAVLENLTI